MLGSFEVFKKRSRVLKRDSRLEPAYWRDRLFRNTFTYKGKRVEVRGWCVRIQLLGKRKTFPLHSSDTAQAAGEACQVYRAILEHGWEGVAPRRAGNNVRLGGSLVSPMSITSDVDYWRRRLIHRKYPEPPTAEASREFAVRIEHAGTGHYFPLGTANESEAAALAMAIYRTVVRKGWACANKKFPRELSLALRWQDNPLAWTYTTFHTRPRHAFPKTVHHHGGTAGVHGVMIIDADASIRFALAEYINCQGGFRCDGTYASAAEALREIPRRQVDLVLLNYDLPEPPGAPFSENLKRVRPELPLVCYSVFDDADQLFKSAPGGAVGYMLKRTPPFRLLEPLTESKLPLSREQIAAGVRNYFQRLSALLPSERGLGEARLTPREQDIMTLLSKGKLAKEIAGSLRISVWTVQDHMKSIFEKLNVHTRTEAVVKYLQK